MKVADIKMYEARLRDAQTAFHNAVKQIPIGTEVSWMRGEHKQRGTILRHGAMGRVLVMNTRTNSTPWLEASDLLP